MKLPALALALAAIASGCASTDSKENPDDRMDAQYVTGSNIPKRSKPGADSGVSTYDKETVQRARDQAIQTPRPGLGGTGG